MGPSRDERPGIAEIFRDISESCRRLQSPTYAEWAACVVDWCDEEPLSSLLAPYADARVGDMLPLRLFAALHRLTLEREAPELAIYVPSVGGALPRNDGDRHRMRRAFLATIDTHRESIAAALTRIPQTNEVGRAEGLAGLLRRVQRGFGLPVRLHEIGCSAGLSLRVEALVAGGVIGAEHPEWGELPRIVERRGCDLSPVDATIPEGRLLLTSFVWPDHPARFERLRSALLMARQVSADIECADALDYVRDLRLERRSTLVVWHSGMWLYLSPGQRAGIHASLEALGAQATLESPLVHIALEPISAQPDGEHRFTLTMTTWPGLDGVPGGVAVPWGTTTPSGEPVDWNVPCAGAIVRDPAGRILLVQRGQEPARGTWSIPGGRIERDEPWDRAAAREVREETGIEAVPAGFCGIVERDSGSGTTYVIADFRLAGEGEPRAGDDADDARWVDPADIPALPTSPGLIEALRGWGFVD